MAQPDVPVFPEHEFDVWLTRECLFIEGHCLILNKVHKKKMMGLSPTIFIAKGDLSLVAVKVGLPSRRRMAPTCLLNTAVSTVLTVFLLLRT